MGWGFPTITQCAQAWFDEYKQYAEKGLDPLIYVGSGDPLMQEHNLTTTNGHFTAMVNAATSKLGCGKARGDSVLSGVVYVCNYYPAGNIYIRRSRSSSRGSSGFIPAYQEDIVIP